MIKFLLPLTLILLFSCKGKLCHGHKIIIPYFKKEGFNKKIEVSDCDTLYFIPIGINDTILPKLVPNGTGCVTNFNDISRLDSTIAWVGQPYITGSRRVHRKKKKVKFISAYNGDAQHGPIVFDGEGTYNGGDGFDTSINKLHFTPHGTPVTPRPILIIDTL